MGSPQPLAAEAARQLFEPIARFSHLAVAVSGGPDSLALLHLLARWRAERGHQPDVTVLTVDHGLRPGSRDEALMVGRMAAGLGLTHAMLDWVVPDAGRAGLQARARVARYDLMARYCHAHDIPAMVTAHHLDDQAETFLMRLKRGSGLDGLAAMAEESTWAGIRVLRPLLDVPKARLVATLLKRGVGWAEDPSNDDQRFERSRMRAGAGALATLGVTPEALARSARRLRRARAALDHAAQSFLAAHSEMSEAGYCRIDRAALAAAPSEIALRALQRVIAAVGCHEAPIRLAKLEALISSLTECPAKTRTLGLCRLEPLAGGLGVFRETRGMPVLPLAPGERALWDNRFRVALGTQERGPVTVRALGESGWRDLRGGSKWLASLPRLAGRTLPACWRGEELLFVPHPGLASPWREDGGLGFSASFVNAGLIQGAVAEL
jgi:tRNA(Ile)-lysidine synthase